MEAGQTPGLRVPLKRAESGHGFLLYFGPGGIRVEEITESQAMTLLSELARGLGLVITSPPRPS
ncbi:hypothetical protein [Streptomyces sp. V1I1]|uniref:hypothetical protein n=1 Tax=Streptomyces sp. V1I1 TaxID=3042272 RepID=UPI002780597C|nr:hypothetical protein [Streptomyces sp. V1I1]MDQ0943155.1 hypothetical protein [Streptomyces sp. V1I1]